MELFNVEKLSVLGEINESFKEKIKGLNPVVKSYFMNFQENSLG